MEYTREDAKLSINVGKEEEKNRPCLYLMMNARSQDREAGNSRIPVNIEVRTLTVRSFDQNLMNLNVHTWPGK